MSENGEAALAMPPEDPHVEALRRYGIVAAARLLEGTPFVHQQRTPGRSGGIDCVGVPICVARLLALRHEDFRDYGREADGNTLEALMARCCEPVAVEAFDFGHILVFWIERRDRPQHVAIATSKTTMIHAHQMFSGGAVREESIDTPPSEQAPFSWRDRIVSAWRMLPW